MPGVTQQSVVGFLTLFEHYNADSMSVGSFLKLPILPIWERSSVEPSHNRLVCSMAASPFKSLGNAVAEWHSNEQPQAGLRLWHYDVGCLNTTFGLGMWYAARATTRYSPLPMPPSECCSNVSTTTTVSVSNDGHPSILRRVVSSVGHSVLDFLEATAHSSV